MNQATEPDARTAAERQVAAVARRYLESWYSGDADGMAAVLHLELAKRTVDDTGNLREVSRRRMVDLTEAGGGERDDPTIEVIVDDVTPIMASVRVRSSDYVDFLQLLRTSSGWQIVNTVFDPTP